MKPKTIVKMLRKKGPVYVEALITDEELGHVEAKKSDLIYLYQNVYYADYDTGMKVERQDDGSLLLTRDHGQETLDQ